MFFFLCQIHNQQILIMTKNYTWFVSAAFAFNFLAFYPFTFYFDQITPGAELQYKIWKWMDLYYWMLVFWHCFVGVLPVVWKHSIYDLFWPRVQHLARVLAKKDYATDRSFDS